MKKRTIAKTTNKTSLRMSRKERSLHIKEQDVDIDDDKEEGLKIGGDDG